MNIIVWVLLCLGMLLETSLAMSASCSSVYYFDNRNSWNKAYDQLLHDYIHGKNGDTPLYFYWHMSFPALVKFEHNQFILYPATKRSRHFLTDSDIENSNPIAIRNTLFMKKDVWDHELVEKFLEKLERNASPEVIQSVRDVEAEIGLKSEIRQGYGYASFEPFHLNPNLLGSWRVYNGTATHSATPAALPFEIGYKQKKIRTRIAKKIKNIRRFTPNRRIFEIGKRFLDREAAITKDANETNTISRVRAILDLFLLRYYIDVNPPDSLFYIQVSDPKLVDSLNQRYGFRKVATIRPKGQTEVDYILEAEGHEISENLRKIFDIPKLGFPVSVAVDAN
jgi:hypothetical protein